MTLAFFIKVKVGKEKRTGIVVPIWYIYIAIRWHCAMILGVSYLDWNLGRREEELMGKEMNHDE
jgi:hypothetical protein